MNNFVSKLLDLLDGKKLVIALLLRLALLLINLVAMLSLVTTFGSYGAPYYNPLWNLAVYNPSLYNILILLGQFEMLLFCLFFIILGLLIFVFAMVIKRDRNIGRGKE
jgi:uncharacterized membrane protein